MRHARPQRVTPELLAELEALMPLAPLHEPHNRASIGTAMELNSTLPQVACFDTAFHRGAPEVAEAFALPRQLFARVAAGLAWNWMTPRTLGTDRASAHLIAASPRM
jgi:acetate kinase